MRHLTVTIEVTMQRATLLALFFCLLLSLGCTRSDRDSPSDGESADTPAMKRAPVQGGELEYETRGDGEPVLLIHGSLIAASFLPLMDESALADYRAIRYHRRGYAGSTAAEGPLDTYIERAAVDAEALLRHLGADRAHVVGHSYGGLVALQLAHDAPEVVHSLVLLEPPLPNPSASESAEEANPPGMESYRAGDPIKAVDQFLRAFVTPEWRTVVARTVPGGVQQAERDASTNFEIESPAWHRWNFDSDMAEKISQPILYLRGSEGYEIPDLAHAWWPQMEHHMVQDVTHALQMEDPQAVAEAIADFLDRHPF